MFGLKKFGRLLGAVALLVVAMTQGALASEIDLKIPSLDVEYNIFGYSILGSQVLLYGLSICVLGMLFGLYEFVKIKNMPAHKLMLNISSLIYATCKTYMKQQSKLLVILELFIFWSILFHLRSSMRTPL